MLCPLVNRSPASHNSLRMFNHARQQPPAPEPLLAALRAARCGEGCPLGTEEALLALASPPLYTPFPNPYVQQFLSHSPHPPVAPSQPYSREPIALDITAGRTDPVYMAQNYHTKVPYRAIASYIEHYTDPGDLVLDGFCGSGMAGIAANQTGRRALLVDLSPAATFLAHSYCHPIDLDEAAEASTELIRRLEEECGWLYRVPGAEGSGTGTEPSGPSARSPVLDYVIWSELFRCPRCSSEFPFSEAGFDFGRHSPRHVLECPACGASLHHHQLRRVLDGRGRTREVPVRVAYVGKRHHREHSPDPGVLLLQEEIDRRPIPYPYPDNPMMNRSDGAKGWGDMWRRGYHTGMERVSDFYSKRSLWSLAAAVRLVEESAASLPARQLMLQLIVNASTTFTRMRRAYQGVLPLVLYVPKLKREVNVPRALAGRFHALIGCLRELRVGEDVLISTQSTTSLSNVPDSCVDYIFTDPPFGDNIRYSEVNFLWEAWLGVFTDQRPEAIISPRQRKDVAEYQELMRRCFAEMHRVLKPGRWITVAFHNSESRVWNAVQEALREAGFEVAEVGLLGKQQITFKQASAHTVRRDLVISARRRAGTVCEVRSMEGLAGRGADAVAWEFVRERLADLPLPVPGDGAAEATMERRGLALFNRMVATHLREGTPVTLDAQQFLAGLAEQFLEREEMYFLPEQAQEYDRLVAASKRKI